jgi:ferredoxin-type protein NapH
MTIRFPKIKLQNLLILLIFLASSLFAFFVTHSRFYLFDLPYIGGSIFIGLTLFDNLPRYKKQMGRRLSQFLVGLYFMCFLAIFVKVNMQIEGFFFQILSLFFGGAFIHYAIAKIFGPVFFGRGFCGWACWNAMVFDLLPWKKSRGRLRYFGLARYLHLAVVLAVVFILFFKFSYSVKTGALASLTWFAVGNIFYFITGTGLAWVLADNRSFCKYLCPIPPIQKLFSRFSILKFRVDPAKCHECRMCEKACPMDIRILAYKNAGERVKSTECIACNACANACNSNAISANMGFDVCTREYFNYRNP